MEDIITIDGPTSSGKNSVGFLLAKKLGYKYIDTGMIYRAGAFKMLKMGVLPDQKEKIMDIYKNLNVRFETDGGWKMFLDGEDMTYVLHDPQISDVTSKVSAIPQVRDVMKAIQRKLANAGEVVMGGRDIGSEIFPEAQHKFFLTASVEIRAKRRFEQLKKKDKTIEYNMVLKDMIERDKRDSERKASPMRVPEGAITIDNSSLTVEQTVEEMLKHINA